MRRKRERIQVVIDTKAACTDLVLPAETTALLKQLDFPTRKAFAVVLMEAGWTCASIARSLGITRQAVNLYRNYAAPWHLKEEVQRFPIPRVPIREIKASRTKRVEIDENTLKKIKALYEKARLVRGPSPKYRQEAEDFTRLAWEQYQRGVTMNDIATALGITEAALHFRFVRYGYKETTGKTNSCYRKLTHRAVA